jgi:hypothetical protein
MWLTLYGELFETSNPDIALFNYHKAKGMAE